MVFQHTRNLSGGQAVHDLMRRMMNARFDAGAVLRAKNSPTWRVFNKAVIGENAEGCPVSFRYSLPGSDQSIERPLDPDWIRDTTDGEIVRQLLDWLAESRSTIGKPESTSIVDG